MVKEGDFVMLEYEGIVKETNTVFEKTEKPIVIPIGKGFLPRFLEEKLKNVEVGKEYIFEFKPEEAFGERDPDLIKIIPLKEFTKRGINPFPGLTVNVNGILGVILSVSSGRVIVDFNHPLAGKNIIYKVKIIKKIEDLKEKIEGFLAYLFNMDMKGKVGVDKEKKVLKLKLKDIVKNKESLEKLLGEIIPEIKDYRIELE